MFGRCEDDCVTPRVRTVVNAVAPAEAAMNSRRVTLLAISVVLRSVSSRFGPGYSHMWPGRLPGCPVKPANGGVDRAASLASSHMTSESGSGPTGVRRLSQEPRFLVRCTRCEPLSEVTRTPAFLLPPPAAYEPKSSF